MTLDFTQGDFIVGSHARIKTYAADTKMHDPVGFTPIDMLQAPINELRYVNMRYSMVLKTYGEQMNFFYFL